MWLDYIRLIFGFPAVFLLSGFPLARLLLPEGKTLSLKLIITSFAFSLFLTYPAAVLTTILEGQSAAAIYSVHLPTSLFSLSLISLISFIILFIKKKDRPRLYLPRLTRSHLVLLSLLVIYSFLVFWNLGRTDILGDDYDLAYQAYNLQDGVLAARKAYVISFNTHPPLFMTAKHFWFQLVSPLGLETVPTWGYRGLEGFLGIGIIAVVYLLVRDFLDKQSAVLAAAILCVNNYLIFLGRVYLREIYLTFFLTLSLYFFHSYLKDKNLKNLVIVAFLTGCGLLIKTSAVVVLPVYLLVLIAQKKSKDLFIFLGTTAVIYLPVLIYNLLAFLTTGHLDATFSKIFGLPHPFLTGSSLPLDNFWQIISYLIDGYSLPVFLLFVASAIISLLKRRNYILLAFLLPTLSFFIFSGPLRGYYLLFLTVPLAIISSLTLARIKYGVLILLPLLLFSGVYSFQSNLVFHQNTLTTGDIGIGEFAYSNVAGVYQPERGWTKLTKAVSQIYTPGDCLEKSGGVNDLAMRAYFQTDDAVKRALLGPDYPHRFLMCDGVKDPVRRIEILYNSEGIVQYQLL